MQAWAMARNTHLRRFAGAEISEAGALDPSSNLRYVQAVGALI